MKNRKISNFELRLTNEDKAFILGRISEILSSNRWTAGTMVEQFERAFCEYTGIKNGIACVNGGFAIVAILQALGIPEGSLVICPTLTAPPTPHAVLAANMRVVFADSNMDDLGLDPADVEEKIKRFKRDIKAVITVHVGGWISPRLRELKRICDENHVFLIEDCAHAHGSWLDGKHAGTFTGLSAFSFFMTKPLTCGEGGFIGCDDEVLAGLFQRIRNYGKDDAGKHVTKGFNYKLSEFNAAIALWAVLNGHRLADERRAIAALYNQLLKSTDGVSVVDVPECKCSYYKYAVLLDNAKKRDAVKKALLTKYDVEPSGGIYDTLCHEEPYFQNCSDVINAGDSFAKAASVARRQICLPLYPGLTPAEVQKVAESLQRVLKEV